MQKSTFIILSNSYIIRKGISYIISLMDNTLIYDELEKVEDMNLLSSYHVPDFIAIDLGAVNKSNVDIVKNYIRKYKIEIISFTELQPDSSLLKCKLFINLFEKEEDIKNKLIFCMRSIEKNGIENKINSVISKREKNVLQLVAKGYTNKEIAEKLFISLHTVITHRKNITKKLGIKTVSGLTVYAILHNIIELKEIEKQIKN